MSILNELRHAISTCGRTHADLARELGLQRSQIHRFAHGERNLHPETLDRLADALDLELRPKEPAAPATQPKKKRSSKTKR